MFKFAIVSVVVCLVVILVLIVLAVMTGTLEAIMTDEFNDTEDR